MGDLTEIQSAQPVKIAGANPSTGVEDFFMEVKSDGTISARALDGAGSLITSSLDSNSSNQALHALVPDATVASTALGSLNATVLISMIGRASVGFQISAGTLIGTLTPECSIDGGTTWTACSFFDPVNSSVLSSVSFGSANGLKIYSVLPIGGSSHVRVRVSSYTSGTANALLRGSQVTGAAGAITAAAFGTITNSFVALSANSVTLILASNTSRKYAYIANSTGSAMTIQMGSGTGLSTTTGIEIGARTFYEFKGDNLYTGNIYGFASSGITVSVTEGTP